MIRVHSIGTLLLAVTALLTLVPVTIFAIESVGALERREEARRVASIVDISTDLFLALQDVRIERGIVNAALATEDALPRDIREQVEALRARSEMALDAGLAKLTALSLDNIGPRVERIGTARARMAESRLAAHVYLLHVKYLRAPEAGAQWSAGVNDLVDAIDDLSGQVEAGLTRGDSFIAGMVRVKQIVWSLRSDTGDDGLMVHEAMVKGGSLSEAEKEEFARRAGRIDGAWRLVRDEARLETMPAELKQAIEQAHELYFSGVRPVRVSEVEQLSAGRGTNVAPRDWLQLSAPAREATFMVSQTAFDLARARAVKQAKESGWDLLVASLLMMGSLGLGMFCGSYVFTHVVRPMRQIMSTMARVAKDDLACEIPFDGRSDEIGSLARALRVFRDAAIERQRRREARSRQKPRTE